MHSYLVCWFSLMALMHFPSVSSELLMFPASFSRSPVLWVREQRSEPARSHRASLHACTHTENYELIVKAWWAVGMLMTHSLMSRTLGTPTSYTRRILMEKMLWLPRHKHTMQMSVSPDLDSVWGFLWFNVELKQFLELPWIIKFIKFLDILLKPLEDDILN